MRHQTGHVTALVADASDVFKRTIWIGRLSRLARGIDVTPEDLILCIQPRQRGFISKIATLAVRDGQAQESVLGNLAGEWGIVGDGFDKNVFTSKLERTVSDQRPRKQPRFAKDLKAVADAQHRSAIAGELLHRLHHRTKPRNR